MKTNYFWVTEDLLYLIDGEQKLYELIFESTLRNSFLSIDDLRNRAKSKNHLEFVEVITKFPTDVRVKSITYQLSSQHHWAFRVTLESKHFLEDNKEISVNFRRHLTNDSQ